MVAYGDSDTTLCFFCSFQYVCFSMERDCIEACHSDHIKMYDTSQETAEPSSQISDPRDSLPD